MIGWRLEAEMKLTAALTTANRDDGLIADLRAFLRSIDEIQAKSEAISAELLEMAQGKTGTEREIFEILARRVDPSVRLAGGDPVSLAEAQSHLAGDEALVAYHVGDRVSFVWAVTKTGLVWKRVAAGRGQLAAAVAKLRHGLDPADGARGALALSSTQPDGFDLAFAGELYSALWAPIAGEVASKTHVLLAPSGPLTSLPFQVLVSEAPQLEIAGAAFEAYRSARWLVRDHALSVLPSASALIPLRQLAEVGPTDVSFLGVGDPQFGPCENQAEMSPGETVSEIAFTEVYRGESPDEGVLCRLAPLPETRQELEVVADSLGAGDLLLGVDASERVLKARSDDGSLAKYRVLMFATHGLVAGDADGLAEPGLALSVPAEPGSGDDGYLTATEVAGLRLNADWVILSACNTAAGGSANAEALSGLASSFIYAGARALLVSHWAVYSDAAVSLTTNTFAAMQRHRSLGRAGALREAMLAMIDSGSHSDAHPSRWAPFTLIGDGR
jgi:CHAT domain-containing protein